MVSHATHWRSAKPRTGPSHLQSSSVSGTSRLAGRAARSHTCALCIARHYCIAGAPLLLVHVSGQEAAAEIGRAQLERGISHLDATVNLAGCLSACICASLFLCLNLHITTGHCVFGETCPQYLTLTAEKLKGGDTAGNTTCGVAQVGGVCGCSFGEWEGAKYLLLTENLETKDSMFSRNR